MAKGKDKTEGEERAPESILEEARSASSIQEYQSDPESADALADHGEVDGAAVDAEAADDENPDDTFARLPRALRRTVEDGKKAERLPGTFRDDEANKVDPVHPDVVIVP